jgi:hypothetical protein
MICLTLDWFWRVPLEVGLVDGDSKGKNAWPFLDLVGIVFIILL